VQAALDWRDHMVSGYEDAGQEKWLADRGIALVRGVAGPAWSTWTALATRRSMLSDVIQPFPSFSTIFDSAFNLSNGDRQNAVAFAAHARADGTAMTVEDDRR